MRTGDEGGPFLFNNSQSPRLLFIQKHGEKASSVYYYSSFETLVCQAVKKDTWAIPFQGIASQPRSLYNSE
jgi:hypothetical protein